MLSDVPRFGDEIANIGLVNKNKPGKYLIRRADDIFAAKRYQSTKSSTGNTNSNTTDYKAT